MWVYKITNKLNNKGYIGITSNLQKRWNQHKHQAKSKVGKNYPLYRAIRKYGIDNFKFEVIEENVKTIKELGKLERFYINKFESHVSKNGYNLTMGGECCQYDGNPRTKLTVEDVMEIRTIYEECKIGVSECWLLYKSKISYSAFEKIWEGQTWKGIMDDVYTKENKEKHKKVISKPIGSKNPSAIYTEEEVLQIRKFYVNNSLSKTYEKYGQKSKNKTSFRGIIDRCYLNVPVYSKTKKKWFLNKEEIDIENYKPVSTISGSGE